MRTTGRLLARSWLLWGQYWRRHSRALRMWRGHLWVQMCTLCRPAHSLDAKGASMLIKVASDLQCIRSLARSCYTSRTLTAS